MQTEVVEIRGHIIDSLVLPRVLDEIIDAGAEYRILSFEVGRTHDDPSFARIEISAAPEALGGLLRRLGALGAATTEAHDARAEPADRDGVFPEGFYSTTSLPTRARVAGQWLEVENPEMDCGIVVAKGRARTAPMSDIRAGDLVVCGQRGVRVTPLEKPRHSPLFGFMTSEVSSEKPQGVLVERIADLMREVREARAKILWVLGPAVVHTGSIEPFCALVRGGWVNVVFAGNALAAHDAEAAMFGTSLGVSLSRGAPAERGHEHHLRAINAVRRAGSIAAAVEQGVLTRGILRHLVTHGVDLVLGGSVRDDGPMPGVVTDVIEAQRAMREHLPGVGLALMLSTMLHSIATGNLLPATVPIVCVDINPATLTKLLDRGSIQSLGMVTDVGLFVRQLAGALGAR
ncbi:MAG: TIGR00300 family protein [Acidobacteria bacterium]|nr:TIGR00300 family protein [Acidobacteriota bacterium]